MGGDGPSPKRRRTDKPELSAEDIAHANSTLHVFTGQRQNRWMHGWVSQDPSSMERMDTSAAPTRHAANAAPFPHPVGVTNAPHVATRERASDKLSMPATAAHPGLPSPVLSEDTGSSNVGVHPAASSAAANSMAFREQPLANGSSQLAEHAHPRTASTSSNTPQATSYSRGPPEPPRSHELRSSSLPNVPNGQPPGMVSYSLPTWQTQKHAAATAPSQMIHIAPPKPTPADDGPFSRTTMLQRFDAFSARELTTFKINEYDNGRLALLREAIYKGDMFYIVLSQIHALRSTPQLIPTSAQRLNPVCFNYLDRLLCGNDCVTAPVLTWLSMFPGPILSIYFSPQTAAMYEPFVVNVVHFLSLLAQVWGGFERECLARRAPPLVEELATRLHLPSPVFQTTAFRAIARLILREERITSDIAMQNLEHLHRMDMAGFQQGWRRQPVEIAKAQLAFAKTVIACKQHEEVATQRHLPKKGKPPKFQFPSDVINIFQMPRPMQSGPGPARTGTPARSPSLQQHSQCNPQSPRDSNLVAMPPGSHDRAQQELLMQQARQRAAQRHSIPGPPPQPHGSKLLFPRDEDGPRAQPSHPNPHYAALHQAHLRSPRLVVSVPEQANGAISRLYRHVTGFALSPTEINGKRPMGTVRFNVPEEDFQTLAKCVPSRLPGEPPSRTLSETSYTYRLRCAALPPNGFPTEASWIVADGQWPENLYLEFNGAMLEPRRKLHHGRYLPIDLTSHVKCGNNEVKFIINRAISDRRPFRYVLAVEIVGAMSHSCLMKRLPTIPAKDSLESMQQSLSGGQDDEEIAITSSNLTIQLVDPYSSSKIYDVPVRGSACAHKDCFDLETFLELCKRETPNGPTVVDCWRCPLCRGDVRPHTLVVDGFLVGVRKQLEQKGLLHTRAITVEADGSWNPKEEERMGVRSPSLEREERGDSATSGMGKKLKEVIEIDD